MESQGVWDVVELTERIEVDTKKDKTTRMFLFQAFPKISYCSLLRKRLQMKFGIASKLDL